MSSDNFYKRHLFFCTNEREPGKQCCMDYGARALRDYAKKRSKQMRLTGPGGVRVNTAGCLDRCSEGPVCVVYPEGTWYTYRDSDDIDEIVERHLRDGEIVRRLQI